MRLRDLPSTSVNFLCYFGSICELSVQSWNLQSTLSTLSASPRPSVNFRQVSVCRGTRRQLSVQQQDLPSAYINLPFVRGTFCQLSVHLRTIRPLSVRPRDIPSTSVNFMCIHGTFCHLSVWPQDLPSTAVNFCASADLP